MASQPLTDSQRVKASPRARRAMERQGIDPRSIQGTGPGGRIVEADVRRVPQAAPAISAMRRTIARVTAAGAQVPHFHLRSELDASAILAARAELLARQPSTRPSVTDFLLRAMALALRDNPAANTAWQEETLVRLNELNVGLVVSLDQGLLLSALRRIDRMSLAELAQARSQIVAEARAGRVPADAARGVATTLSNLGTTRVDDFSAVLFPGQTTILTAGRIVERAFVVDGKLCVRPTLRLTLTVDHRVLDGAPAAQFLGRIVSHLEHVSLMP